MVRGPSRVTSVGPRDLVRPWAQAFYAAYPAAAGVLYGSSMYGYHPTIALFERALPALPARPVLHRHLADPLLHTTVLNAAADVGYCVV